MSIRAAAMLLCLSGLLTAVPARALIGEEPYVSFTPVEKAAALVEGGIAAPLWLDRNDHPGVLRAARDLQTDIERVSGIRPTLDTTATAPRGKVIVIAGTAGRSRVIDDLVAAGKLDVAGITGKWESFLVEVIERPASGIDRAIVIAGSDPRGTIFGLYDLSRQIGVSPWYWWADVPVKRHDALYVQPGRWVRGEPAVKYRGIFLNDEAPALSGWAREKFGGFNHEFYAHVFELILRLRGNYLWPAMWGSAFIDDDPRNAPLAHEYGIVIGTSHHEPMMRAHDEWRRYGSGPWDYSKNEAKLREFWRGGVERVRDLEKLVTIGMRGDGDEAMSEETNVALLQRIVADQRTLLREIMGREPSEIPQVWALYKEVQEYYERGMRVPDDVTLLWCDDNWGNIRRLPLPSERSRSGGAGVYYHFDYVGGPRNYKWINTIPIHKIREQMHLAWAYGANRIWIVNVGDLKPMEFPIEFFLTLAWDPSRWSADSLDDYSTAWAAREFGAELAPRIAALINGYTKLNGRRKPEMLAPDTYSLVNYREAERVLAEWSELVAEAQALYAKLPGESRSAFFQLVLYPVEASANLHELYVATGRNRLYALQGRAGANAQAERARALFAADGKLARAYHELQGGKWNHMMSQAKMGYVTWQQPDIETMPAVHQVRPRAGASMAVAIEGTTVAFPSYGSGEARLPPLDAIARGTRWIEIFNRGGKPFRYEVTADRPWISLTSPAGSVTDAVRIEVGAKWEPVPAGRSIATLTISADTGERVTVQLPLHKPAVPPPPGFEGFIETDGHVAIEAPHFSRTVSGEGMSWEVLPDFGRTLGGVTIAPVTAPTRQPGSTSPRLEYDVHLFSTGELDVELHFAPSLDFQGGEGLRFALSFDDEPPRVHRLSTEASLRDWSKAVADGVRRVTVSRRIDRPGRHVLKFWMVTPGVVLQRILIDAGGIRPSYLGPPESPRGAGTDS
ncbi:MAG TPA: glycosyl hydrolase 115 family protein [Woeseiaceae bacterium]|nr:glycosyl hydrolase 115 family protein [Woeseiaceae bacterium]